MSVDASGTLTKMLFVFKYLFEDRGIKIFNFFI